MGWWDEGIMGGDTPLDYKGNFEDEFGSSDPEFNEWRIEDGRDPIEFRIPTSDEAIKLINEIGNKWGAEPVLNQVVGWLFIERGGPMNDELRALILQGIDEENPEEDGWGSPSARQAVLDNFRNIVVNYPADGAKIEMPHQPGLFEKMAEHFN